MHRYVGMAILWQCHNDTYDKQTSTQAEAHSRKASRNASTRKLSFIKLRFSRQHTIQKQIEKEKLCACVCVLKSTEGEKNLMGWHRAFKNHISNRLWHVNVLQEKNTINQHFFAAEKANQPKLEKQSEWEILTHTQNTNVCRNENIWRPKNQIRKEAAAAKKKQIEF